jgi:hypothetical protein
MISLVDAFNGSKLQSHLLHLQGLPSMQQLHAGFQQNGCPLNSGPISSGGMSGFGFGLGFGGAGGFGPPQTQIPSMQLQSA